VSFTAHQGRSSPLESFGLEGCWRPGQIPGIDLHGADWRNSSRQRAGESRFRGALRPGQAVVARAPIAASRRRRSGGRASSVVAGNGSRGVDRAPPIGWLSYFGQNVLALAAFSSRVRRDLGPIAIAGRRVIGNWSCRMAGL